VTLLAVAVLGRGLVPVSEPVLHADDEALLRGRAAFETIRVYGGRPFRLDEHLERLARSAELIGLPAVERPALASLAVEALAAANEPEAVLRLFWTPGREGSERPSGLALVSTLPPGLEDERARGLRLVSVPWAPSALLAGAKSTSYAPNMAAQAEARRRAADDALFVAPDGAVLEAPTANVWLREGRTLLTPSLELGVLAGVTRRVVIEAAPSLGYAVLEGSFPLDRVQAADEVLLSSSVRELMPVVAVDGHTIGTGRPGATAADLQQALRMQTTS
jgi:4-amino-4-deoxychorismate lyase